MAKSPRLPRYERPVLPFERKASPTVGAGRYLGAGLEFGAAVVLFFLGGRALDDYLGSTDPWMTIVGALLGVAVGTWLLVRPFLRDAASGDEEPRGPQSKRDDG